jgi:hypothetical protein
MEDFISDYNLIKEALLANEENGHALHAKLWDVVNYAKLNGEGPPEDRP